MSVIFMIHLAHKTHARIYTNFGEIASDKFSKEEAI